MVKIHSLVVILVFLLHTSLGDNSCDYETVVTNQCGPNETCVPTNGSRMGLCQCLPGYIKENASCTKGPEPKDSSTPKSSGLVHEDDSNGHSLVLFLGIFVPIALILVVVFGIYFSRKYNILVYLRIKFYQRNNNYDEVMIGQDLDDDDPPLC